MHEVKCDKCNEKFGGENKFKTHMRRICVKNPTVDSLYMKNWFLPNECIRVFCNEQKEQLAILHSKQCEEENPCPDVPPNLKNEVTVKDSKGMIHLHAWPNIENDTVEWNILRMNIYDNDHIWT